MGDEFLSVSGKNDGKTPVRLGQIGTDIPPQVSPAKEPAPTPVTSQESGQASVGGGATPGQAQGQASSANPVQVSLLGGPTVDTTGKGSISEPPPSTSGPTPSVPEQSEVERNIETIWQAYHCKLKQTVNNNKTDQGSVEAEATKVIIGKLRNVFQRYFTLRRNWGSKDESNRRESDFAPKCDAMMKALSAMDPEMKNQSALLNDYRGWLESEISSFLELIDHMKEKKNFLTMPVSSPRSDRNSPSDPR